MFLIWAGIPGGCWLVTTGGNTTCWLESLLISADSPAKLLAKKWFCSSCLFNLSSIVGLKCTSVFNLLSAGLLVGLLDLSHLELPFSIESCFILHISFLQNPLHSVHSIFDRNES